MNSWDWTKHARCSDYSNEQKDAMWNLNRTSGATSECTKGRKVCENCPVRPECLATAIVFEETAGIWGGVNRRIRLHLARDAKSCNVPVGRMHSTRVTHLAGWIRTNPDAIERAKAKDCEKKRESRRRLKERQAAAKAGAAAMATAAEVTTADAAAETAPGMPGGGEAAAITATAATTTATATTTTTPRRTS